ncbi:hypothetical protein GCM10027605_20430 [Micromonospora zhanjiangensis]
MLTGDAIATDDHQSPRARLPEPVHGRVAGGPEIVQLGRRGTRDLGHQQGRMWADGGGDQWHALTVTGAARSPCGARPGIDRAARRTPYGHGHGQALDADGVAPVTMPRRNFAAT